MKKVIIMFGEMGAGKNYHGTQLAKLTGYEFFDGDTVATPEMIARVAKFRPLTRDIVERYVEVLSNAIADKMEHCENLIVAQALYLDEDRKSLALFLTCLGYEVEFEWVRTTFWRNARQLLSRPNGWRWVLYWLINKPFFQKPTHEYEECHGE